MVAHEGPTPPRSPIDSGTPSATRMYDFYLGGRDNYASDRNAVAKLLETHPQAFEVVRNNRMFLARAVTFLAEMGIDQIIDVGAGIPMPPTVHELVRAFHPEARIVYVDNDPMVLAHDRALLATDTSIGVVDADAQDPRSILDAPETRRLIDVDRPFAVLFVGVLEFCREDQLGAIVGAFRERMVPGSYVALSHLSTEGLSEADVAAVIEAYEPTPSGITMRPRAAIEPLFAGFDVVEPGLVDVAQWRSFGKETYGKFLGAVGQVIAPVTEVRP